VKKWPAMVCSFNVLNVLVTWRGMDGAMAIVGREEEEADWRLITGQWRRPKAIRAAVASVKSGGGMAWLPLSEGRRRARNGPNGWAQRLTGPDDWLWRLLMITLSLHGYVLW
jgi:hypothetical protein